MKTQITICMVTIGPIIAAYPVKIMDRLGGGSARVLALMFIERNPLKETIYFKRQRLMKGNPLYWKPL